MTAWLLNVLVALDQGFNALLGPALNLVLRAQPAARFGNPDETLSSVMGKNIRAGQCRGCRLICRVIEYFDPGHCAGTIEDDER